MASNTNWTSCLIALQYEGHYSHGPPGQRSLWGVRLLLLPPPKKKRKKCTWTHKVIYSQAFTWHTNPFLKSHAHYHIVCRCSSDWEHWALFCFFFYFLHIKESQINCSQLHTNPFLSANQACLMGKRCSHLLHYANWYSKAEEQCRPQHSSDFGMLRGSCWERSWFNPLMMMRGLRGLQVAMEAVSKYWLPDVNWAPTWKVALRSDKIQDELESK